MLGLHIDLWSLYQNISCKKLLRNLHRLIDKKRHSNLSMGFYNLFMVVLRNVMIKETFLSTEHLRGNFNCTHTHTHTHTHTYSQTHTHIYIYIGFSRVRTEIY